MLTSPTEQWLQSRWSILCNRFCPLSCRFFPAEWTTRKLSVPTSTEHLRSSGFYIKALLEELGSAFNTSIHERSEGAEMIGVTTNEEVILVRKSCCIHFYHPYEQTTALVWIKLFKCCEQGNPLRGSCQNHLHLTLFLRQLQFTTC